MTEAEIQQAILREFGARSDMRLWRANVLVAKDPKTGRVVRAGVRGQADISGIRAGGQRIEIEVKTPNGRQSKEQRAWQRMIERFDGIYILARSVQDVRRVLG